MNESPEHPDDLLNRAIRALRDSDIPAGPGALVEQRAILALSQTQRQHRQLHWLAIAATVLIAALLVPAVLHLSRQSQRMAHQNPNPPVNVSAPHSAPPLMLTTQQSSPPTPHVPAPAPAVLASNVSISGHVFLRGTIPPRRPIYLQGCPECEKVSNGPLLDDTLITSSNGGLANVVISTSAGLPPGEQYPTPAAPVVLDQKGCMFHPHVVTAMIGQPIVVKNSDPLLHTVHSMDADETPAFNFAQPATGQRAVEPLQVVETFKVKCDLHPWMTAWVRVFNHPYFAVTSSDGTFAFPNLPPGHYRLKAWHELLGVEEKNVTVEEGSPAMVDFLFEMH